MKYPFEAEPGEVIATPEAFVDAVFSSLVSEFLVLPKGAGFLDYGKFVLGFETLKRATDGFARFDPPTVLNAALEMPVVLVVLRAMLGFTPPEWAYLAETRTGVPIPQGAARTLDRDVRISPETRLSTGKLTSVTRDAVRLTIHDYLWSDATGLPVDCYEEPEVAERAAEVFRHVFRAYPELPSPFYPEAA